MSTVLNIFLYHIPGVFTDIHLFNGTGIEQSLAKRFNLLKLRIVVFGKDGDGFVVRRQLFGYKFVIT